MTFRKFSKRATAVSLLLGILFVGSLAFAAWTATGTGNGSAQAITPVGITVTATTATADLYPGKTDGSLYVKLVNPNPYGVSLTTLTKNSYTVDAGHAACNTPAWITLNSTVSPAIALAANDGSAGGPDEYAGPIPNVVGMALAADNTCQGATFTINLTISGTST